MQHSLGHLFGECSEGRWNHSNPYPQARGLARTEKWSMSKASQSETPGGVFGPESKLSRGAGLRWWHSFLTQTAAAKYGESRKHRKPLRAGNLRSPLNKTKPCLWNLALAPATRMMPGSNSCQVSHVVDLCGSGFASKTLRGIDSVGSWCAYIEHFGLRDQTQVCLDIAKRVIWPI